LTAHSDGDNMPKKMKKNRIRAAILFALTFVFLFFFFRSVEWREVLGYLNDIDLKYFIALLFFIPVNLAFRAIRWNCLLKHEKQGVSFFNRFAGNAVGFAVTFLFPGRLGELVKPLYLAQKENLKKGFVIGTVVVERMFDLFNMCFLLGVFFVSRPLYTSIFNIEIEQEAYSNLALWGIIGIAIAVIILLVTLSLYFFKEKTLKVIAFFLKPLSKKWQDQIMGLIDEFIKGLKFFHSVGDVFVYIFWSFVVWLNIAFFYWLWLVAYDVRVPFFYIFPYVFLTMVGASIPTPGMVGGFDYFSKYGLTSLYGVETNMAVGMTLVIHAIQLAVTYVIGYGILWKEGISLFQVKKLGEEKKL
jgi:uncharacterized protein (TIRG00374 family)